MSGLVDKKTFSVLFLNGFLLKKGQGSCKHFRIFFLEEPRKRKQAAS